MELSSFLNGFVELETLGEHPEACLQAAPIGVREGEVVRGAVLDPHIYEGLMRLAIAHRHERPGKEYSQNVSDALDSFIDMGERLLGGASNGVVNDEDTATRPHRSRNPDDDQAPS
tara:strand:- start:68 stop:415 length:348 start_codon:yes stop_codon:yes gene_type:complete